MCLLDATVRKDAETSEITAVGQTFFQFQGVYKSVQIGAPKKWINDTTSIYYAIIKVDCCLDLSYFKR